MPTGSYLYVTIANIFVKSYPMFTRGQLFAASLVFFQ